MEHELKMYKSLSLAFVLLAYRNSVDLEECIASINTKISYPHEVYVVDSYYDDASSSAIEKVALAGNAKYIRVKNKGYSYGNNVGIAAAMKGFNPDFCIVSNPDTVIEKFDSLYFEDVVQQYGKPSEVPYILAPRIKTLKNKDQNPYLPYQSDVYDRFVYEGFKFKKRAKAMTAFAFNRLIREFFVARNKCKLAAQIYAPHGSFIMFSGQAVRKLDPVFDEKMFLFVEEGLLAYRSRKLTVPIYYCPRIRIRHKEDGSIGLLSETNEFERQSYIYVYEKTHDMFSEID